MAPLINGRIEEKRLRVLHIRRKKMKAVGYRTPGSINREDAFLNVELPKPRPGPRDLLVQVKAISVNPADTKFRASSKPADGTIKVLGWDAAGIVEAVGADATLFKPGDEVFYAGDMNRAGTNAEFHLVDERIVGRKPVTLDWAEAAALPLTSITAWELLFDRMRVPYGQKTQNGTLLVINGAGGVGSILIQIARRLTGLTVIATASRTETVAWAEKMGAHNVIDHRQPLHLGLKAIGVQYTEFVAGLTATAHHFPAIVELIAPQGHLALIDDPEVLDIAPFKRKAATVSWEFMFTRPLFRTPDMNEQGRILNEVSALIDAGVLVTTLTSRNGPINAANLKQVHAFVESGKAIGKTVLVGF
jgi:zinc-binding alcohol dehydrogenase family protein